MGLNTNTNINTNTKYTIKNTNTNTNTKTKKAMFWFKHITTGMLVCEKLNILFRQSTNEMYNRFMLEQTTKICMLILNLSLMVKLIESLR